MPGVVPAAEHLKSRLPWTMRWPVVTRFCTRSAKFVRADSDPEEVGKLLAAANPKIVAWFALCVFAGVRPIEAAKLAWTDIGAPSIRIHATIAKTRRNRFVPVLPALSEWLRLAHRNRDGLVGFFRAAGSERRSKQSATAPRLMG